MVIMIVSATVTPDADTMRCRQWQWWWWSLMTMTSKVTIITDHHHHCHWRHWMVVMWWCHHWHHATSTGGTTASGPLGQWRGLIRSGEAWYEGGRCRCPDWRWQDAYVLYEEHAVTACSVLRERAVPQAFRLVARARSIDQAASTTDNATNK